jgi:disulfide bond formation protein DsbB
MKGTAPEMKTATSLALAAIGAILAFAIMRSPSFLNLQVVGWILMLTGGVGAIIPRRGYGWLRRSMVVKGDPDETGPAAQEAAIETAPETQPLIRHLMPRAFIRSPLGVVRPVGQVEQETIEEYVQQ